MTQLQAPPEQKKGPNLTPEEKTKLDCWPEADGWCSACGAGKYPFETECPVVHLGSKTKGIDFALCGGCLARMSAALPSGAASETETGSKEK